VVGPPADLTCLGSCFSPLFVGENPGGVSSRGVRLLLFWASYRYSQQALTMNKEYDSHLKG
ncbi:MULTISPECIES: hypothetical protein, partial [Vibrio]